MQALARRRCVSFSGIIPGWVFKPLKKSGESRRCHRRSGVRIWRYVFAVDRGGALAVGGVLSAESEPQTPPPTLEPLRAARRTRRDIRRSRKRAWCRRARGLLSCQSAPHSCRRPDRRPCPASAGSLRSAGLGSGLTTIFIMSARCRTWPNAPMLPSGTSTRCTQTLGSRYRCWDLLRTRRAPA